MSNDTVFSLEAVSEVNLVTPTSTQQFPLGAIITVAEPFGTTAAIKRFMYIQAGSALVAYSAYLINFSNTATKEVTTGTPATSAVYRTYGVAPVAFTTQFYGWIQIEGLCTALSTTDTTKGDVGKCANTVVTITDESTATLSASSIGMWLKTGTGSATRAFQLFGVRATVA